MPNNRGMTATTDQASADLVVDMSKKILELEPGRNKLLEDLKQVETYQTQFYYQDDQMVRFSDTLGAAVIDAVATSFTVSNRDRWAINDLALIPSTGEIVKFTAVTGSGSGTATVTRGAGGTAAAAASGAALIKIGSSWGEGSSTRDSSNNIISLETQKNSNFNYTQIERTVVAQTGTQIAVGQGGGMYSGDPRKYQQAMAGKVHARKRNHTAWYGKRAISGNDRKTGGFLEFVTTTAGTTTLSAANIDTDLATFFRYGEQEKKLYATRRVSAKLSATVDSQIIWNDPAGGGDLDKGMRAGRRVRHYLGDSGEFDIVVEDALGDYTNYAGYGVFIDHSDTAIRYLHGRNTKLYVDAQLADVDGKVDYILDETGIQRGLAAHHAAWTAVAA